MQFKSEKNNVAREAKTLRALNGGFIALPGLREEPTRH
jgi:hypothetical protein